MKRHETDRNFKPEPCFSSDNNYLSLLAPLRSRTSGVPKFMVAGQIST